MEISPFQYERPTVQYVKFLSNLDKIEELGKSNSIDVKQSFNMEITERTDKSAKATLSINLKALNDAKIEVFKLNLQIGSKFVWENVDDEDLLEYLLKINTSSLLLSYARPIIAQVTSDGGFPPYHLPFINFTNESERDK